MKQINNIEDFNEVVSKNDIVVVDFFTKWCGPCKAVSPFFESLEKEFPHIKLSKCDCEAAEDVAFKFKISSIPMFIKFEKGKEVERVSGADKNKILELFNGL